MVSVGGTSKAKSNEVQNTRRNPLDGSITAEERRNLLAAGAVIATGAAGAEYMMETMGSGAIRYGAAVPYRTLGIGGQLPLLAGGAAIAMHAGLKRRDAGKNKPFDKGGIEGDGPNLKAKNKKQGKLQPAPKPAAKRKQATGKSGGGGSSNSAVGPMSFASVSAQSKFGFGGQPQKMTDISGPGSSTVGIRIVGSDIFTYNINVPNTNATYNRMNGSGAGYCAVSPGNVSPRLLQMEELFQFYAFRKLIFRYRPAIYQGITTWGSDYTALGFMQSYDGQMPAGNDSKGFQKTKEMVPSVSFTNWCPAQLVYNFTGTRVWECDKGTETESENLYQGMLVSFGTSAATASGVVTLGYLEVDYVIDFYNPIQPGSNPTLMAMGKLARKPEPRYARAYAELFKLALEDEVVIPKSLHPTRVFEKKERPKPDDLSQDDYEFVKRFAEPDTPLQIKQALLVPPPSSSSSAVYKPTKFTPS